MRRFFPQALTLIGLSVVLAAGAAWLHPRAPAWFLVENPTDNGWDLTLDQVAALPGEILWVDARKEADFAAGHVPGAIPLNEERWGALVAEHLDRLQAALDSPVVVYCDGSGCERSHRIAERLRQTVGLDRVYVLRGDWRKVRP